MGAAVALTRSRSATCQPGSGTGAGPSHSSSSRPSRSSRSWYAANMSSSRPAGNSASTASQLTYSSPCSSATWWSSQTCGVWLIPYRNAPKNPVPPKNPATPAVSSPAPRGSALVNTIGIVAAGPPPDRRASSRCTRTPL